MSLEDDILIDNYLRGLLTPEEKTAFDLKLKSDSEFKENFELETKLWNSMNPSDWSFIVGKNSNVKLYEELLEEDELQSLKQSLSKINNKFRKDEAEKGISFKYIYLVAASIIVLVCLNLFLNQGFSNQDLVDDYLSATDLPSYISRNNVGSEDLVKAQTFFENEDYTKALELFETAKENKNKNDAALSLYIGISQMRLKKFSEAETTFDDLINSDLLDAQKGYWFKALLYLDQDRIDKSKSILNQIVSESLYNYVEAQNLLNKIRDE